MALSHHVLNNGGVEFSKWRNAVRILRAALMSNLRIDLEPVEVAHTDVDLVLLPGNISRADPVGAVRWAVETFKNIPVMLVPGLDDIHEFGQSEALQYMRDAATGTNVHVMDNDRIDLDFGDRKLRVLGTMMSDASRSWLKSQLEQSDDGETIVLTHLSPEVEEWIPVIGPKTVPVWVHGEAHSFAPPMIGATSVLGCPRLDYSQPNINPRIINLPPSDVFPERCTGT